MGECCDYLDCGNEVAWTVTSPAGDSIGLCGGHYVETYQELYAIGMVGRCNCLALSQKKEKHDHPEFRHVGDPR